MSKTYFIGNGFDCVRPFGLTAPSLNYRATDVKETIGVYPGGGFFMDLHDPDDGSDVALTTFWTHFNRTMRQNQTDGAPSVQWLLADDTPVVQIVVESDYDNRGVALEYWTGSAWQRIPMTWNAYDRDSNNSIWDVYLDLTTTGKMVFLLNRYELARIEGNFSALAGVARIKVSATFGANDYNYYQQLIVADYNTVNHVVRSRGPNAAGANVGMSGDYTAVDEFPLSTDDFITSNTAGEKSSFLASNLSEPPAGVTIKAVSVGFSARTETTGPQHGAALLRLAGVDYIAARSNLLTEGFSGYIGIWPTNPSTGVSWANMAEANCEFGVESQV